MAYNFDSYKLAQNNSVLSHSNYNGLWEDFYGDNLAGLYELYVRYCDLDGSQPNENILTRLENKPVKADRATISAAEWSANVDNVSEILNEILDHTSGISSTTVSGWVTKLLPNRQIGNNITTTQWNTMVGCLAEILNAMLTDLADKESYLEAWKFGDPMPIVLS